MLPASGLTPDQLCTRGSRTRRIHRILQFPLTRLLIGIVFLVPTGVLMALPPPEHILARAGHGAAALVAAILGYAGYVRLIERRPVVELSRHRAGREWAAGAGLGTALILLTLGALVVLDALRIGGVNHPAGLYRDLPYDLPQTLFEELLFRALIFKICEESLGSRVALAIQAALFGVVHLLNPDATLTGAVAIALEAGLLLGGAYALTRRLWAVWGLHFAWNYVQGRVFSGSISGMGMSRGLLSVEATGPEWLTGGAFGVEASPFAVGLCLAAAFVVLRAAHRRGLLVSFGSRPRPAPADRPAA